MIGPRTSISGTEEPRELPNALDTVPQNAPESVQIITNFVRGVQKRKQGETYERIERTD